MTIFQMCVKKNGTTGMLLSQEITNLHKENHTMTLETYKKIIDDACQYKSIVCLSLSGPMGDPLMNGRIEDFYEYAYAKKHFKTISVNTNGAALHKRDIRRLLNSTTEFSISLDSIDTDTYEKIHGNRNVQQVIDNIKSLVEHKKSEGCVADIWVRFTEHELNKGQFPEFKEFCTNLGVDGINYTQIHSFAGIRKELQDTVTAARCSQPTKVVNFDFLGNLSTCCVNWHLEPTFGNIKDATIKQLWEGQSKQKWNEECPNVLPCLQCGGLGAVQKSVKMKVSVSSTTSG